MSQKRVVITKKELVPLVMSEATLYKLCQRDKRLRVRRACNSTDALYDVASLPYKFKVEVYNRYPNLKEQEETKPFVERIEDDVDAVVYYSNYRIDDGRYLPLDKQEEYANNCAILNAFDMLIREADTEREKQSQSRLKRGDFWQRAASALDRISDTWVHSLPSNPRSLQRVYRKYLTDEGKNFEVFVSKKFMNKHTSKVRTEEQCAMMTFLCAHHNNLQNTKVAMLYNQHGAEQDPAWEKVTAGVVARWRSQHTLEIDGGRLGLSNFANKKAMQVKRSRPEAPFLFWSLDGWVAELLYQKSTENKKGHRKITYHNRMTVVVVLDPSCDYPIGYAVGEHESPALIKEALRNAVYHSRELCGVMLKANQLQSDRYSVKTLTPLYEMVGDKFTPARVKNAKAKPVESYFKYLNETYCQLCGNWSGYGITTDPDKQPNSEALNANRKSFPDAAGVAHQIASIIEMERSKKHAEFMQKFEKLPLKRRIEFGRRDFLLAFGAETGYTNRLEGAGMRSTLLGERRTYDSFDISFREHAGEDWRVLYDPEDLTTVLAVSSDGSLQYLLEEKYEQPMALAERTEGDAEQLQKVFDFNEKLGTEVARRLQIATKSVQQQIKSGSQIHGLLGRLLITDSTGQHKDNRSQEVEAEDVDFEEYEEENDYSIF